LIVHQVIVWNNAGVRSEVNVPDEVAAMVLARTHRRLDNRTVKVGLAG
jgi:hypothetical protein